MTALQDRLCKVPKEVLVMSALSSSVRRSVASDASECGAGSARGGGPCMRHAVRRILALEHKAVWVS